MRDEWVGLLIGALGQAPAPDRHRALLEIETSSSGTLAEGVRYAASVAAPGPSAEAKRAAEELVLLRQAEEAARRALRALVETPGPRPRITPVLGEYEAESEAEWRALREWNDRATRLGLETAEAAKALQLALDMLDMFDRSKQQPLRGLMGNVR